MNEVASSSTPPRPSSTSSPPPKCAICLGTCTNKCFSDSCMHQFCFTCLLEWSKVKAECPLCKQPFKSIIHNIKSNDEYDEHFIEVPEPRDILGNEDGGFLYLPPAPSRHFQFRTTFTVDPDGELAIQQMLLSHPLTNNMYNVPREYGLPRYSSRFGRRFPRRASSATSFRRWIYMSNMWVYAPPDLTGRYRDVSPHFYRDNPAARNRLVPWLNRELNALLRENTQQVMHLVDVIMDHLTRSHIRSRAFKNLLSSHLGNKTNHFVHEFYNFMRSPYDMIGYDRHIVYTDRPYSPTYSISDHDDDSDVAIVNISEPVGADNNPFRRPTIEVIEINSDSSHDSDVIIRETPVPEIVLVDSDSTTEADGRTPEPINNNVSDSESESEANRKPILPLKIRLKHKRQSRERRSRNKKCCSKRHYSSSSRSSSSSSDTIESSTSSTSSSHKRYNKRKHKYKKLKRSHKESKPRKEKSKVRSKSATVISDNNSSNDESDASKKPGYDSDDCIPLSKLKGAEKKKKLKKTRVTAQASSSRPHTITSKTAPLSTDEEEEVVAQTTTTTIGNNTDASSKPSCSRWKSLEVASSTHVETVSSGATSPVNLSLSTNSLPSLNTGEYHFPDSVAHFKYEQYNHSLNNSQNGSLPQFENIPHYDTFQPYTQYSSYNRYNPVTIGTRYYDGPDYNLHRNLESYTPPPLVHNSALADSTANTYNNYLYRNELFPQSVEAPSRVNVGVGTSSPIKKEIGTIEQNYNYYVDPGPSSSHRMQSVIVKKEDKENPQLYRGYLLNADSSDSDS